MVVVLPSNYDSCCRCMFFCATRAALNAPGKPVRLECMSSSCCNSRYFSCISHFATNTLLTLIYFIVYECSKSFAQLQRGLSETNQFYQVFPTIPFHIGARTLLVAPGLTPRSKKLLGTTGIATRSKDATIIVMFALRLFARFLSLGENKKDYVYSYTHAYIYQSNSVILYTYIYIHIIV